MTGYVEDKQSGRELISSELPDRFLDIGYDLLSDEANVQKTRKLLVLRAFRLFEAIEEKRIVFERESDEEHFNFVLAVGYVSVLKQFLENDISDDYGRGDVDSE